MNPKRLSHTRRERRSIGRCIAQLMPTYCTAEEIGAKLGITRQRVEQIEEDALYKIFLAYRMWAAKRHLNGGDETVPQWKPSDALIERACPFEEQRGAAFVQRAGQFMQSMSGRWSSSTNVPNPNLPKESITMLTEAEQDARRLETDAEAKALGYVPVTFAYDLPSERPLMRRAIADLARSPEVKIALVGKTNAKLAIWRKG